jgi:hypothetical protein
MRRDILRFWYEDRHTHLEAGFLELSLQRVTPRKRAKASPPTMRITAIKMLPIFKLPLVETYLPNFRYAAMMQVKSSSAGMIHVRAAAMAPVFFLGVGSEA